MVGGGGRNDWRGGIGDNGGARQDGRGLSGEVLWWVVKKIEAAAKAERVLFGIVEGLALSLVPEGFRILWHSRSWRGWGLVAQKGVGFHLAELGVGVPRAP